MDIRDEIAIMALQGLLASGNNHWDGSTDKEHYAKWAYRYADVMLWARTLATEQLNQR